MVNYLINFSDEDYVDRVNLNSPKLMIWHNTETAFMISIHTFNLFDLNQQLFRSVQLANIVKDIQHDVYEKVSTYLIDDNFNINDQKRLIICCLQQLPFLINDNFTFLSRYAGRFYTDSASLVLFDKDILQYTYIRCQGNTIYDDVDNHLDQTENTDDIKNVLLTWYKKMHKIISPYMLLNDIN